MLTLYCLGDLRLERGGITLLAGRRKPLALLAFLARRGSRPSSRDALADLLWGKGDDASARKSLRQCLSDLRSTDGVDFTESDAGIQVSRDSIVTDAALFEADVRAGHWDAAVQRWRGEFIAGGDSLGDAAWQSWLDGERAALRRQLSMACEHLTAAAEQRGEWRDVIVAAERWRRLLPDDDRARSREIHALQASGRLADAVARATEAEHHFRNELRVAVPDEVARLSRVLSRVGQVAGTAAASLLTPDLVGRRETLAALARARLQSRTAREQGITLLLPAAEGAGKTRVLRDFARLTHENEPGVTIIEASALTNERDRPFSLVQDVITGIAGHDALAGCSPETLSTLAQVAPAIRDHFRHVPTIALTTPADVAAAFSRALAEVARGSSAVMILDDFPEADALSLAVLVSLLIKPPARTLIVVAGRQESWRQAGALAEVLQRAGPANRLTLDALKPDETKVMLASMAPLAPATLTALTESLHDLGGGNPGLVASLMTHRVTTGALVRGPSGEWASGSTGMETVTFPPDVEDRWRARYGRMSADVQRIVDVVSVLGSEAPRSADVVDVEQIAQLDPGRFRDALDALMAAGVLQRAGDVVGFAAGLHQRLAFRALPPSMRLSLHAAAAKRLRAGRNWPTTRASVAYHRRASRSAQPRPVTAITLGVAALVGLVTWYNVRRDAATVRTGSPVLLADVENLTGDSTFDRTLYLAASVGLQQSRQISLFPRSRVRETLALMQRPGADSVLDESLAREVATRENLQRVLLLGVARIDSAFVLTARIIHPPSGRDLFVDRARAATRGDILDQLDGLLTRVRRASGESGDSLRAYAVPLPRVTTSSLVALHAYAAGTDAWTRRRYDEAKAAFQRAVALDSTFALAWLGLAEVSYQLYRDRPAGDAALTQALQYADRLTERERLRLEQAALGYRGRVDQEVRIAEQLARRFPERDTWYSLGTFLMRLRRCPEAIPALERSLEFDSTFAGAHINVATCHQFLGASDSAVAAYGRAYAVDTASVYTGGLNHEFGIALVRAGRVDSARRVFERMARRSQPQDRQFGQRSLGYLAAWLGRARDADAHFDSAAVLAAGFGTHLSEFRNRILQAETRLTMGMRSRASLSLDASTQLATRLTLDPGFAMHAGLAYVTAGQLARASKMLEVIVAGSRAASASDRTIHAVMSARIALARGDTDGARRALEAATDTTWNDFVLPALLDVHAARGHADSALDASMRLASRSTFGTAAQEAWMRNLVRLAESAERIGRRDLAQETYVRLEAQLSAGDPDHPLLTEARAGIARLAGRDARQELPVRPPRP